MKTTSTRKVQLYVLLCLYFIVLIASFWQTRRRWDCHLFTSLYYVMRVPQITYHSRSRLLDFVCVCVCVCVCVTSFSFSFALWQFERTGAVWYTYWGGLLYWINRLVLTFDRCHGNSHLRCCRPATTIICRSGSIPINGARVFVAHSTGSENRLFKW